MRPWRRCTTLPPMSEFTVASLLQTPTIGVRDVADASQVLFFNRGECYRVSHPNPGGDASLVVSVDEALLREIAPAHLLREGDALAFRLHRLRIDARAQVLVALLRHSLREGIAEPLE